MDSTKKQEGKARFVHKFFFFVICSTTKLYKSLAHDCRIVKVILSQLSPENDQKQTPDWPDPEKDVLRVRIGFVLLVILGDARSRLVGLQISGNRSYPSHPPLCL